MMRLLQSELIRLTAFFLSCALLAVIPASGHCAQEPEDILLRALKDELARSVAKLHLRGLQKPYYIKYAVDDAEELEVKAVFGAIVKSDRRKKRLLRAGVRVGGHQFDNSEFIGMNSIQSAFGTAPRAIVQEDDYAVLRHDIWLATDTAYKQALVQLAGKQSYIKTKVRTEKIPDFSREAAITSIAPREHLRYDATDGQKLVRSLSSVFRDFPAIYDSSVSLHVKVTNKYFLNSEGTVIREPFVLLSLYARASTQAPDGMQLHHFVPFHATDLKGLPSENEMTAAIRKMAEELSALTFAPVLESYIGPILVTGEAAGELFAQVLAPHLSGHRPPLMEQQQMAAMLPASKLTSRLNRRVLPSFLSVVDDPTQTTYDGHQLIGSYRADDQGILAQPVTLIEDGVLKTLLMSRRPRKEISRSNGHGRVMQIGSPAAQIGNLFIRTSEGKSPAELKQDLIELCKDQGLPYGLLITRIDDPNIAGREFSLFSFMMPSREREASVAAPLLVYTVSVEDGREELVRGLMVEEMSVRMLKEIVAAGSEYHVNNRLTTGGGFMGYTLSLGLRFGGSAPAGIPTAVVAPSVLFEEVELRKSSGPQQRPALLTHPFFSKHERPSARSAGDLSQPVEGESQPHSVSELIGTWKMVTAKWGGVEDDMPKRLTILRHETRTHSVFVWIDPASGRILEVSGGMSNALKDGTYILTTAYGFGGVFERTRGQSHSFTWKIRGDKWYHAGSIADGMTVEEVWERVAERQRGAEHKLIGTWKLVRAKYEGRESDLPKSTITLMHVTPTQTISLRMSPVSKRVRSVSGGMNYLGNDTYREHAEYGLGADFERMRGKAFSFTWKVEGNKWYRTSPDGEIIDEVWERVEGPIADADFDQIASPQEGHAFSGRWKGRLDSGNMSLRIVFNIYGRGKVYTATIDSPDQKARAIKVSDIRISGKTIVLESKAIAGTYTGRMDSDSRLVGTWSQGGSSFPLDLIKQ